MQGEIVQFDPAKGFGFVKVAGQKEDVFIHQSDVDNGVRLRNTMQIEFDLRSTSKGPRAANIKVLSAAPPGGAAPSTQPARRSNANPYTCLLYTSDAADERSSVDLGGRRIIKKHKKDNRYDRNRHHKKT